jgi:hypothetical protein
MGYFANRHDSSEANWCRIRCGRPVGEPVNPLLDAIGGGAELPVHEGIEQAMTEQASDANLVFTITPTTMPCEFAIGMAATTECVIGSVLAWVEEIDGTDLASRQLVPTSNSTSSGTSNSA